MRDCRPGISPQAAALAGGIMQYLGPRQETVEEAGAGEGLHVGEVRADGGMKEGGSGWRGREKVRRQLDAREGNRKAW